MAFIAPKHEGASRPRAEVNKCHTSRGARDITITYPVGMATIELPWKINERRRVEATIRCSFQRLRSIDREGCGQVEQYAV